MRRWRLGLWMLALIAGLGCADKPAHLANRQAELEKQVNAYHECFSWREYDKAASFVLPSNRPEFKKYLEELRRGYTLESYSIKAVQMSPTGEQAAVVVIRSFVQAPSVTLQTQEFTLQWTLHDGVWYLAGPPY